MSLKLDILAFGSHPDDVELSASGTLVKHISKGYKAGIIDLTRGELGTRGNAGLRDEEAKKSSAVLGISVRENLDLGDGFFEINKESLIRIIETIRAYQPTIILCNAVKDRHPDHKRGGNLVSRAAYLSGLVKIQTNRNGQPQTPWRPKLVLRYVQDNHINPGLVVDITREFDTKMKSIMCFSSQFYNPASTEPETPISSQNFIEFIKARAVYMGRIINTTYGEGFVVERAVGVEDLTTLI
jgi:bacillithiol biosynthesis deacetylase BshB1